MLKKPKEAKQYKWNSSQLKWLEALENGEYTQGAGRLCQVVYNNKNEIKGLKYCCLGVASDLFCTKAEKKVTMSSIVFNNNYGIAPNKIVTKLKLNNEVGLFKKEHLNKKYKINVGYKTLTKLNDSGWSFKRIAKFIRDNPEAVFRS